MCCKNATCPEITLGVMAIITMIISLPGLGYSAIFWLFVTAFSAGRGWWIGLFPLIIFLLLLVSGILEAFFGAGICCKVDGGCRKCALVAATVLRGLAIVTLLTCIILFANLGNLFPSAPQPSPPPPWPPNMMPPPSPSNPPWAPTPPFHPRFPAYPPNPPMYPITGVREGELSGIMTGIIWLLVVCGKIIASMVLNVLILKNLKPPTYAGQQPAQQPPPVAMGVAIPVAAASASAAAGPAGVAGGMEMSKM